MQIVKEIKLEIGENPTPFIPNKEDVKAENQAVFPIGGGITKSTLYSGYKGLDYVN